MDSDISILTDLSSDLSSLESRSPSLAGYPSPISSQDRDTPESLSNEESKKRKSRAGDEPVAKKRRKAEPKPRTTETLDLTQNPMTLATKQHEQLELLMRVLRKRRKIVVIAGAGISVSAGIPDFRSSTGLFKSLKSDHKLKASGKQLFDASVYQTDSSTSSFHDMVRSLSGLVSAAKPTVFHQMLSTLGAEGRLMRLYTQNVDGIDVALPSLGTTVPLSQKGPWPRTVQLHGGLEKMVCSKCRSLSDFEPELFNGPEPPPCSICIEADRVRTDHAGKRSHGIGRLRPRIVLYNEHNPDEEAIGGVVSADLRSRPDAVIVVGTSMKIPGVRRIVREMCGVVRSRRDGLAVWINQDGPPLGKEFEDCWDLIVKGPCDEVARQWDLSVNPHEECTQSDIEQAKGSAKVEIQVGKNNSQGMITPAASPLPTKTGSKLKIKLNVKPEQTAAKKQKPPQDQKKGRSNVKMVKKNKTAPRNSKINQQFKAAKPNTKPAGLATKDSQLELSLTAQSFHPMEPLSPLDARNNGPVPKAPDTPSKNLFPNLLKSASAHTETISPKDVSVIYQSECGKVTPVKREKPDPLDISHPHTPPGHSRPSSAHRMGTVSPTSIPKGMEALID